MSVAQTRAADRQGTHEGRQAGRQTDRHTRTATVVIRRLCSCLFKFSLSAPRISGWTFYLAGGLPGKRKTFRFCEGPTSLLPWHSDGAENVHPEDMGKCEGTHFVCFLRNRTGLSRSLCFRFPPTFHFRLGSNAMRSKGERPEKRQREEKKSGRWGEGRIQIWGDRILPENKEEKGFFFSFKLTILLSIYVLVHNAYVTKVEVHYKANLRRRTGKNYRDKLISYRIVPIVIYDYSWNNISYNIGTRRTAVCV